MVGADRSLEVFQGTPLETCRSHDRAGLDAKTRAGLVKEVTGFADPDAPPVAPGIALSMTASPKEDSDAPVGALETARFLRPP